MRVFVNGKPVDLPESASVEDLLRDAGLQGKPVAVEVNGSLVPKRRHAETRLREGDKAELVTLVGGG